MSTLLDDSIAKLKEQNIRITPQRHAILEFLIETETHPTADDIYKELVDDFPNMSVATVYNNLRLLTRMDLVNELKYGDTSSRFDFSAHHHYHAICSVCGKISDIQYPGLDDVEMVARTLTGYDVSSHRLEIYGICPECQARQAHND